MSPAAGIASPVTTSSKVRWPSESVSAKRKAKHLRNRISDAPRSHALCHKKRDRATRDRARLFNSKLFKFNEWRSLEDSKEVVSESTLR